MPILPSGKDLAICMDHISPPGMVQFICPPGHYWYSTPDLALNAPPFHPEQRVVTDWVHAPCPSTREEALAILQLFAGTGPEIADYRWTGYFVGDEKALADLDAVDRAAWDAWIALPKVQRYLDRVIATCRLQAEANGRNCGFMGFVGQSDEGSARGTPQALRQEAATRANTLMESALELEDLAVDTCARHDRLAQILAELDTLVDGPARATPHGWHARGVVARLLGEFADAERSFLEAARHAPFALAPWIELARARAEQGKFTESETAARRAVTIHSGSAPAWANLAFALDQLGRREEAIEAAESALKFDPEDEVAARVIGGPE